MQEDSDEELEPEDDLDQNNNQEEIDDEYPEDRAQEKPSRK